VGAAISALESALDVAEGHRRRVARVKSPSQAGRLRGVLLELTRVERLLPRSVEGSRTGDDRILSNLVEDLSEKTRQVSLGLLNLVTASHNREEATQRRLANLRTALDHLGEVEGVLRVPQGEGSPPLVQLENDLLHTTLEVKGSLQGMVDLLERTRDAETVRLEAARKIVERVQAALHRGGFLSRRLTRRARPR